MQKDGKIRILHMTPPIIKNGIYQYIFSNLSHIDRERFQFDFLVGKKEELMQTKEYQEYHFGIRAFSVTPREDEKRFREEITDILSDGYDVIQLHTSFWQGFIIEEIAMNMGIPKVVVHSHSSGIDEKDPIKREMLMQDHERLKKQFGWEYATDLWACSRQAADWLYDEKIPRDRICIVPNAIDIEAYAFREDVRARLRKELGLEGCYVLGHTGRFEYQKNHEFLLKLFAEVKKKIANAKLLLAGNGSLLGRMQELARQLGIERDVLFLGWRQDIADLLQAMDIYCLPSRFEGLSIVSIEAQASGLKCLAGDAVPEEAAVTDNFTALPLEEAAWVNEISKWENGYERSAPRKQIRESGYDIKEQIKKLEQEYSKI